MSKSPGHRLHPEHKVKESAVGERMIAVFAGQTLADSRDVVRVDEDGHPPRFYFPRGDVRQDRLKRTETSTECPFKGTASYFDIDLGDQSAKDAVWSYEQPYDEHQGLKERMAFDESKSEDIVVSSLP
ncbi:hypothetical protein CDL60_19935 [Roseateles noduli]|nr:hypothetical protein CDL60_19935 [Roseateles noduli]